MILTKQHNNQWKLYFDDPWGEPVGYRVERGEPVPTSFNPLGYETQEEAEKAKLDMEAYIMKHHQQPTRRKRR